MPSSSVSESTRKKGTKQKIEIKKRETNQQRLVAFSKRRPTVFSKAADLCLLSGANAAIFVTSPSESSDVVYSFSGYSSAYEIADCYLNGKPPPKISNPQSKLGFWWEEPDLYHSCDDLSELNDIEDRLLRMKKHVMACLEKKEKSNFVYDPDQNLSTCSLDEDCGGSSSQLASKKFDLNPISSVHECWGDQTLASFHGDQNPNSSSQSCSKMVSFDQNSYPSLASQVSSFDTNPSSEIQGGSSSSGEICCFEIGGLGCETGEEKQPNQSTPRNTNTGQAIVVNLDDESRFWNDLFNNDDAFCLNSDFFLDTTNDMIDLGKFNEEELEWFNLSQFTD